MRTTKCRGIVRIYTCLFLATSILLISAPRLVGPLNLMSLPALFTRWLLRSLRLTQPRTPIGLSYRVGFTACQAQT